MAWWRVISNEVFGIAIHTTPATHRSLHPHLDGDGGKGVLTRAAGSEGAAVAHLGVGEKSLERGKLRPGTPFIGEGERGRRRLWSCKSVTDS
jgi:hypothetical protein